MEEVSLKFLNTGVKLYYRECLVAVIDANGEKSVIDAKGALLL